MIIDRHVYESQKQRAQIENTALSLLCLVKQPVHNMDTWN
jgi:hypothetical protein